MWCDACRSIGQIHCAHPDECGNMRSNSAAAENWNAWLDDLPVGAEFQPAIERLQDFIAGIAMPAPDPAPHVNEPPKSKHDADNVLTGVDLIARLREIQGQAGLFASAAADRIEALVKERDAALASNRGLVRLNEMTEARAQRFEAALEEIASHDTGATAGLAHTAALALIQKGSADDRA